MPCAKVLGKKFSLRKHALCKLTIYITEGVIPGRLFQGDAEHMVKWAPPNHSWPTIRNLIYAVRSSGHEDLAVKLQN